MKTKRTSLERTKHPHASTLKRHVTIRLDDDPIGYFKSLAVDTGIPYQTLINLDLRECAAKKKKPSMAWRPAA